MSRALLTAIVLMGLLLAISIVEVCHAQPGPQHQRHNAYYPYSVETVILDR